MGVELCLREVGLVLGTDKEVVEDTHIEGVSVGECTDGLDGTHDDKEKPTERQTSVHVTQKQVLLSDAPVEQSFAESFPNGRQELPREEEFADYSLLFFVECLYPSYIFDDGEQQKQQYAKAEWKNEEGKVFNH